MVMYVDSVHGAIPLEGSSSLQNIDWIVHNGIAKYFKNLRFQKI